MDSRFTLLEDMDKPLIKEDAAGNVMPARFTLLEDMPKKVGSPESALTPKPIVQQADVGVAGAAGRGLVHGTIGIAETVGTGLEYLGHRVGSESLAGLGKTTREYWEAIGKPYGPPPEYADKNVWDNPELLGKATWWAYNVADMLPSLAATMIPANVAGKIAAGSKLISALKVFKNNPRAVIRIAQAAGGGLFGGTIEGAQTYKEILSKGGSELEAARAGELMAVGAGILNAIATPKILEAAGKAFKGKIISSLGAAGWEGLTEAAEEPTEVFAKQLSKVINDKPMDPNIGKLVIESLKDAATVFPIAAVTGGGAAFVSGGEATEEEKPPPPTDFTPDQLRQAKAAIKAQNMNKAALQRLKQSFAASPAMTRWLDKQIRDYVDPSAPVDVLKSAQKEEEPIIELTDIQSALPVPQPKPEPLEAKRIYPPETGAMMGETFVEGTGEVGQDYPGRQFIAGPALRLEAPREMPTEPIFGGSGAESDIYYPEGAPIQMGGPLTLEQAVAALRREEDARKIRGDERQVFPREERGMEGEEPEPGPIQPDQTPPIRPRPGEGGQDLQLTEETGGRAVDEGLTPKAIIDEAAAEADTQPTEAQKQAGNYRKGHIQLHGLDISIENPEGSIRTEKKPKDAPDDWEPSWKQRLGAHYGYFKRTEGKDGDQVDVFIGPKPESETVFVINQINPNTGKLDEHKVMMGYETEAEARKGYLENYEKGWKGLGSIVQYDLDTFKKWLKETSAKPKAQRGEAKGVKAPEFEKGQRVRFTEGGRAVIGEVAPPPEGKTVNGFEWVETPDGAGRYIKSDDLALTDAPYEQLRPEDELIVTLLTSQNAEVRGSRAQGRSTEESDLDVLVDDVTSASDILESSGYVIVRKPWGVTATKENHSVDVLPRKPVPSGESLGKAVKVETELTKKGDEIAGKVGNVRFDGEQTGGKYAWTNTKTGQSFTTNKMSEAEVQSKVKPEGKPKKKKTTKLSDISVKTKAVREATGEQVMISQNAQEAINEIDAKIEALYEVLECL